MKTSIFTTGDEKLLVYSLSHSGEIAYFKTTETTLQELLKYYTIARVRAQYSRLIDVPGAKRISEIYFAELQQRDGIESCEFNFNNNTIGIILKNGKYFMITDAEHKSLDQILTDIDLLST